MELIKLKKKNNILDILGLNIIKINETQLKDSTKEKGYTDYMKGLDNCFGIFDIITVRSFSFNQDLSGNASFNLILNHSEKVGVSMDALKKLVNTISSEYGIDGNGSSQWTEDDSFGFHDHWEGREWILDKKGKSHKEFSKEHVQVNLSYYNGEAELSILEANKLVKWQKNKKVHQPVQ